MRAPTPRSLARWLERKSAGVMRGVCECVVLCGFEWLERRLAGVIGDGSRCAVFVFKFECVCVHVCGARVRAHAGVFACGCMREAGLRISARAGAQFTRGYEERPRLVPRRQLQSRRVLVDFCC